jgi:dihydroneopterin aldolase
VNQDPTLVHECLSKPGVYLVICEIIIDSVESRHCIAIDTVHQQVSDSLVDHLQRFEPSTFWKKDSITSIRNVAQIWQVMIKESD